jgi:hypothetical protein
MLQRADYKALSHFVYLILYSSKDIIEVACKEIEWEGLDLLKLAQDGNKFWIVANMEMSVWVV